MPLAKPSSASPSTNAAMFHVPDQARFNGDPQYATTSADGNNGAFTLASPEPGWLLGIIASDGEGWEHVSVHAYRGKDKVRTPSWKEMAYVKNQFWSEDDLVIQYHPRKKDYVNVHPH